MAAGANREFVNSRLARENLAPYISREGRITSGAACDKGVGSGAIRGFDGAR
ncbi:MAG TPA: hypothetical protein VHN11_04645 [Xanthobacteraceae bacterium]|nr:hypothetical protein [Xanthobacteraceae bacterium]